MDLSSVELFRDFKPGEIEKFVPAISELHLKQGDILFNEGDPGDSLFIVYEGAIRIFKVIDTDTGEEKSLALLEAGTYLGEMTIMDGTPRSASAKADIDSIVLRVTRADFINLMRSFPQGIIRLFTSFLSVISNRLRATNDELVVLYDVGRIISNSPPLDEMLTEIMNSIIRVVNVDTGIVFVLNEFTEKLEVRHAVGKDTMQLMALKCNRDEGIVCEAMARNEVLAVEDFDSDPDYAKVKRFGYERPEMLIAPLSRRGNAFGAILLADKSDGKPFTTANVNLVGAVANQASAAMEAALFHKDRAAREQFDRKHIQF